MKIIESLVAGFYAALGVFFSAIFTAIAAVAMAAQLAFAAAGCGVLLLVCGGGILLILFLAMFF